VVAFGYPRQRIGGQQSPVALLATPHARHGHLVNHAPTLRHTADHLRCGRPMMIIASRGIRCSPSA
jgi:hypothetical protein